jgi:hypothetical protein
VSHLVDTYPRLTPQAADKLIWWVSEQPGTEVAYRFDPAAAGGAFIEYRPRRKRVTPG